MPQQQPPDVLAMVMADAVLIDVATGKKTIQGTFDSLMADVFPWNPRPFVVYVVLTDGHGATSMQLRLIDVDELEPPLYETEAAVNFTDPLTVLEVVFTHVNAVFPAPGEYRLQLLGAGQHLRERRLQVMSEQTPGQP